MRTANSSDLETDGPTRRLFFTSDLPLARMVSALWTRLKRLVLCDGLNIHVGNPKRVGDTMFLDCSRCDRLAHPTQVGDPPFREQDYN